MKSAFSLLALVIVSIVALGGSFLLNDYWKAHYVCYGVCLGQWAYMFLTTLGASFVVTIFIFSFMAALLGGVGLEIFGMKKYGNIPFGGVIFMIIWAFLFIMTVPFMSFIYGNLPIAVVILIVILPLMTSFVSSITRGMR